MKFKYRVVIMTCVGILPILALILYLKYNVASLVQANYYNLRQHIKTHYNGDIMVEENFISLERVHNDSHQQDPWVIWNNWVLETGVLYPANKTFSRDMQLILNAMASYPITHAYTEHKGTQIKIALTLKGGQKAIFRPKLYERNEVIEGSGNSGGDRHNGEISAFHLSRVLSMPRAPPVVGRKLNLTQLMTKMETKLKETFYVDRETGNICFYGICYYCKPSMPACAEGNMLEGSLTLWLPEKYKIVSYIHPCWNNKFECNQNILQSHPFILGPHLLDLMDIVMFDFLISNFDRHHCEIISGNYFKTRILLLDNGKSFGDPYSDNRILLTPLKQVCKVHKLTYTKLLESVNKPNSLSSKLELLMQSDSVYPVLTKAHLIGLDRRTRILLETINSCYKLNNDAIFNHPT